MLLRLLGRVAATALLGTTAACSGSDAGHWVGDYVTVNDFEAVRGWGADNTGLVRDHAHSGQYAVFVGPQREYSLTYDLPLGEASVHTLKGVAVEAWVYLPSPQAAASLEVQVRLPGEENKLGYAGRLPLPEQVKETGKWTRVRQEFAFPVGLPADAHLRIFMWRNGSAAETVYLDDLRVKALE
ncbi:carbohydrate binding domain-containing protein [Hymenobacter armeniacus]|uniref:Carbohydrate binding domain-containing protein n=1 Tax=Hymenobacter armeniacus TaxID=2771358 RepID=A0ABR8JTX1_9BACT|nr:carbohydrate binding domain-containing protein [Hymenobacter armeniacus]MBD2723439.1 carbohydrate binding domain-containing protein [Hymenobacter armeniacus]